MKARKTVSPALAAALVLLAVAALPYTTEVTADGTAVLTLAYTNYPHLQQTVWRISLRADEAAFRTAYRFENLAPFSMGFNPWIDASFVSSGDIQFTLPADRRSIQLLGLLQFQTGKLDEAGKTLSRLAGTPNDSVIVRYHLGLLAAAAGNWPQAVAEAEAALESGKDLDPYAVDTTIGPQAMPGREP